MNKKLHIIYSMLILLIRGNSLLTYFLFGFYPKKTFFKQQWDWTTLTIKRALLKYSKSCYKLLDIGTGPYAVLAIYAAHKLKINEVNAGEYCKEVLQNAKNEKYSNLITLVQSDLFENINKIFDIIIFNAPYIDKDYGRDNGIFKTNLDQKRWSGGKNGIETINRFLSESKSHLEPDGIIILGINNFYISDNSVNHQIIKSGFYIFDKIYNRITKACAYVLKQGELNE